MQKNFTNLDLSYRSVSLLPFVIMAAFCSFSSADVVPVTFTGSGIGGGYALSATAAFSVDNNGHLVVVVTNTAAQASNVNGAVLTGVFFDLQPQSSLLTTPAPQGSAILTSTSDTLLNVNNTPTLPFVYVGGKLDVSGEWGFGQSATGFHFSGATTGSANNFSASYGIESTGAAFGSTQVIDPLKNYDYDSDNGLQGADFGIVSGSTTSVNGQQDYFVKKSITFTMNFDPALLNNVQVQNVHFTYGTSSSGEAYLGGTPVPTPLPNVVWAAGALLGTLLIRYRVGRLKFA